MYLTRSFIELALATGAIGILRSKRGLYSVILSCVIETHVLSVSVKTNGVKGFWENSA